jgi:hypothetical protein
MQIPRIYFTFGSAAGYPTVDNQRGFSGVGLTIGGPFSSAIGGSPDSDIYIQFPSDTSDLNIYLLQSIFNSVATEPQIIISKAA